MRVEHIPQPTAAAPSQIRGGYNLNATVAGTWKTICMLVSRRKDEKFCQGGLMMKKTGHAAYVGEKERRINPVEQFACWIAVQGVLRQALQTGISQI